MKSHKKPTRAGTTTIPSPFSGPHQLLRVAADGEQVVIHEPVGNDGPLLRIVSGLRMEVG